MNIYTYKKYLYYPVFYATFAAVISGCGSESEPSSSDNNTSQHIIIETRNVVDDAAIDSLTTIDLSDAVKTKENVELRLDSVTPLSEYNKCSVVNMKGLSYSVETDISQVCRFEYTVVPTEEAFSGKAYGSSEVLVSDSGNERITPIARKAVQGEDISIDLSPYLPSGALLDSDSLELRGVTGTGELGTVSALSNTINYIAPTNTSGQVQIYYTAINDTTGMLYSGVIYVAISLDANTAPSATLNSELEDFYLSEGSFFNVDVSSYISDPDGDELQLIDVYSGEQGWAQILPLSTSFIYTPTSSGTHHITYVVSDNRGGYAIGTLYFKVMSYASIYDSANDKTFMPTMTFDDLEQSGGVYTSIHGEDGTLGKAGFYPVFDRELAESYCITRGTRLPSFSELEALFEGELDSQSVWSSQYRWPAGVGYMSVEGRTVSLYNGREAFDQFGYVSCVHEDFDATEYQFTKAYYSADWNVPTAVQARATYNGYEFPLPVENYELEAELISTNPVDLDSHVEIRVRENKVTISRTSEVVKSATVKVTDPSVQGDLDETKLIAGITECPSGVSVAETQVLGCVPVIYEEGGSAFTAALSDAILERFGLDIKQNQPSYFRSSDTIPNYTYLDTQDIFSSNWNYDLYVESAEIHQSLCDLYNESKIGGRDNWEMMSSMETNHVPDPNSVQWEGTLAEELTTWFNAETGLSTNEVGQGYLVHNLYYGNVRQVNQFTVYNYGQYQGGTPYPGTKEWQFLTCFSNS